MRDDYKPPPPPNGEQFEKAAEVLERLSRMPAMLGGLAVFSRDGLKHEGWVWPGDGQDLIDQTTSVEIPVPGDEIGGYSDPHGHFHTEWCRLMVRQAVERFDLLGRSDEIAAGVAA